MTAILTEIIALLYAGISGVASGLGTGITELVQALFLTVSEAGEITGLSTFGGLSVTFAGIALAIGLSRWVLNWVTSMGASN